MKRPTLVLTGLVFLTSWTACTGPSPDSGGDIEGDTAGVLATYRQRLSGLEEDNIEQWLDAHSSDVRFVEPDGADIVGRESLRAWGQPYFDNFIMGGTETVEELGVSADLAFIRYEFNGEYAPKAGGDMVISRGKGVLLFRLGEDGTWKITHNIFTPAEG